jgi:hypothetical protein
MMTPSNEGANIPGNVVVPERDQAPTVTTLLTTDHKSLQARVKQLEEERERDHRAMAALQAERDAYRRAVYAWALEQITDEDLERYAHSEAGLPLDDFIADLERTANTSKDG